MATGERPKNVWVLYGGPSSEREVSIKTAKGVAEALESKGFDVHSFDVRPGATLNNVFSENTLPDIVFLALHGTWGEDGVVQGFLESLDLPFVGSGVHSSALCFHKGLTKLHLAQFGLPCPFSFDLHHDDNFEKVIESKMPFAQCLEKSWFIKPAREGSTIGIQRYQAGAGRDVFASALKEAFRYDTYVLLEEWLEGPELTVALLKGKSLPVVEIRPLSKFYDFESKYTAGKTEYICPAELDIDTTQKLQQLAERCFELLECQDYGRVDFILSKEGPKILEMNTLPGMTGTSLVPKAAKAAGLGYADFLEELLLHSYQRQRKV